MKIWPNKTFEKPMKYNKVTAMWLFSAPPPPNTYTFDAVYPLEF